MVFPCGLSCHWMLRWKQSVLVVCRGSNPVSRCDVCFSPAQFLSRFRVPCTVKYPFGCWMACSSFFWKRGAFMKHISYSRNSRSRFPRLNVLKRSFIRLRRKSTSHAEPTRWTENQMMNGRNSLLEIQNPAGCEAAYWLLSIDCGFIRQILWFSFASRVVNWQLIAFLSTTLGCDKIDWCENKNQHTKTLHRVRPSMETVNIYYNLDHYTKHRILTRVLRRIFLCRLCLL